MKKKNENPSLTVCLLISDIDAFSFALNLYEFIYEFKRIKLFKLMVMLIPLFMNYD